jgi:hypothetical protein
MWNILPTLLTFIFSFYFHSILGNKKICQVNVTYGEWLGVKHFLATNRGWKTWKKHFVGGELPVCWCSNLAHPTIIRNLCDCVTHIIGDLGNDLWLVLPNRYLLPVRVLDSLVTAAAVATPDASAPVSSQLLSIQSMQRCGIPSSPLKNASMTNAIEETKGIKHFFAFWADW